MNDLKKVFILTTMFFAAIAANAQSKKFVFDENFSHPKNVFYGDLGSLLLVSGFDFNYERFFIHADQGESFSMGVYVGGGLFIAPIHGYDLQACPIVKGGVVMIMGRGNRKFELGLGVGAFYDKEYRPTPENPGLNPYMGIPDISIGFRKYHGKNRVFRYGLSITQGVYVGWGLSF